MIEAGTDPVTGKRKRLYKSGFLRKKDAEAAAAKAESARRTNALVMPQKTTFKEFAEEWLAEYSRIGRKPSTIRSKHYYIRVWNQYFGAVPIQQITEKLYQSSLFSLADKYSPDTIPNLHAAARLIFKEARRRKVIHEDPSEFAVIPKPPASIVEDDDIPHYLEKQELQDFLTAAGKRSRRDFIFFTFLAYTGVRIGEALSLMWDDIDFEQKTIRINKTLYEPKCSHKSCCFLPPKTKSSRRIIDADDYLLSLLHEEKASITAIRREIPSWHEYPGHPEGLVFPSLRHPGMPTLHHAIMYRIKKILELMPNPPKCHITPHVFRHTNTSLMAEAGIPLDEIQARLGHSNDATTRRIYLHVTKARKKASAEKFTQFMQT